MNSTINLHNYVVPFRSILLMVLVSSMTVRLCIFRTVFYPVVLMKVLSIRNKYHLGREIDPVCGHWRSPLIEQLGLSVNHSVESVHMYISE